MTTKMTKQGVRDLNHIKGKSRGRRLEPPPIPVACKHKHTRSLYSMGYYWVICDDCQSTIQDGW